MSDTPKKIAQTLIQQGNYDEAAKILRKEIERLEAALTHHDRESGPADGTESGIAEELAELYGIQGGSRRKQGDIHAAAAAYDAGFRYESNQRYRFTNTYNALNRLVMRVLLCPASLTDPEALRQERGLEFVDVRHGLRELQGQLAKQLQGVRSNDDWAAGDLALTSALNGDDPGMMAALQKFASLSPPPYAFGAYAGMMEMLARLDIPPRRCLERAMAWLDDRIKEGADHPKSNS